MLALIESGIKVSRYVSYEIDKYAIKTSSHNFPFIEHMGDVFNADFSQFYGFDLLIGGSPCTYWSICQKQNRETEATGAGWELFSQFLRALETVKPRFFVYENNKSMSESVRGGSISSSFGFEPVCINSSLVSGQHRQRLYWCGVRNDSGGYTAIEICNPCDRNIIIQDIIDSAAMNKLPDIENREQVILPCRIGTWPNKARNQAHDSQQYRIYSVAAKGVTLCGNGGGMGAKTGLYAIPVCNFNTDTPDYIQETDGKMYPIYEVNNGELNIDGKRCPIKLQNGNYIIRKLTVKECMRLQTVPEWFEFPVSDTQAYKMLGNGWTVSVIAHILNQIKAKQ